MEQSLPHTLCSELLLIATLLPTFEFVRSNVVRGPSGPLQQILAAVLLFQASCCKYCDTRLPPPNSRGHRRRMHHLRSRDTEMACLRYLRPTLFPGCDPAETAEPVRVRACFHARSALKDCYGQPGSQLEYQREAFSCQSLIRSLSSARTSCGDLNIALVVIICAKVLTAY
jgi:hypothetical protein